MKIKKKRFDPTGQEIDTSKIGGRPPIQAVKEGECWNCGQTIVQSFVTEGMLDVAAYTALTFCQPFGVCSDVRCMQECVEMVRVRLRQRARARDRYADQPPENHERMLKRMRDRHHAQKNGEE